MDPLDQARHAHARLEITQTRDAAWLALAALEADERCGLALTVLARIILEVNEDPLGTLATQSALSWGLPDRERAAIERFHRVDLWSRGLIAHTERSSMLTLSTFDDAAQFTETPRADAWFRTQRAEWGGEEGAVRALIRMAAALADAKKVPETEEDPLRAETPWPDSDLFAAWKAQLDENPLGTPPALEEPDLEVAVLSDYWIEQEIAGLGASGSFALALERAQLWARLRPHKAAPLCAQIRLHHALEDEAGRDQAVSQLVSLETADLNELEDARVALGELGLWQPQIAILGRMDQIAPGHPVILANRGAALMEIGQSEQAAQDLEQALEADPDNGPALATLGLLRMRSDRYLSARELLERAVEVAPSQAQVRVYLAACKNNQGDKAEALEELKRALELDPDNAQAKQLLSELEQAG